MATEKRDCYRFQTIIELYERRNDMKKKIILLLLLLQVVTANAFADSNANVNANVNVVNVIVNNTVQLEQTGRIGRVNWGQGAQGTIEAIGTGFPPANVQNPSQAKALARRAAIVEAYRNLAETIYGVRVDSQTTVRNLALANDIVISRVSGIVEGARIVRELPQKDGSYQVVMCVNIYGDGSVAALEATTSAQVQEFPQPTAISQSRPVYNYTGVIIDAHGFDLEATLSPRIYDASGRIIYGNVYISSEIAVSQGIVEFAITPDMVERAIKGGSRAGIRPMILKAIAAKDSNCSLVISDADANLLLESNSSVGFLKNCAVVFVK
jgi:hypothetical protein